MIAVKLKPHRSMAISRSLVKGYFDKDSYLINMQDYNFDAQVKTFLRLCSSEIHKEIKLFEIEFNTS